MSPDEVLDMRYEHFIYLAQQLDSYREEEAAVLVSVVFGGTSKADTSKPPESPEELHALFGGMGG